MTKEQKYNTLYMDLAERLALMSYANRARVGAVLVRDGNIVGHGWNGRPAGVPNDCEISIITNGVESLVTSPEVQHAEENLLLKMLKSGHSANEGTMYVSLEPCIHCAKMIYGAGITTVYFKHEYSNHTGTEFLKNFGVNVVQL